MKPTHPYVSKRIPADLVGHASSLTNSNDSSVAHCAQNRQARNDAQNIAREGKISSLSLSLSVPESVPEARLRLAEALRPSLSLKLPVQKE